MNRGHRPWLHSLTPLFSSVCSSSSPLTSCFSSSSPQKAEAPGGGRYKDIRSEGPVCCGAARCPPVALYEGLQTHVHTHTCTHRGQRCEGLDSVRSIVYNRFTYPRAECDPRSRHHTQPPPCHTNTSAHAYTQMDGHLPLSVNTTLAKPSRLLNNCP